MIAARDRELAARAQGFVLSGILAQLTDALGLPRARADAAILRVHR